MGSVGVRTGFAQKQQNPKRWQRWPFQTTNDAAGNFAQKQEMENKQFAADENKTVNRKWSCDEDGVHMRTKWLPIPRVRTFSLSGSDFVGAVMGSGGEKSE